MEEKIDTYHRMYCLNTMLACEDVEPIVKRLMMIEGYLA